MQPGLPLASTKWGGGPVGPILQQIAKTFDPEHIAAHEDARALCWFQNNEIANLHAQVAQLEAQI